MKTVKEKRLLPEKVMIAFGEDNTTALAALNKFYFARDISLCGRLFQLWADLGALHFRAFYINTKEMPADEPSRQKPLLPEKALVCGENLKSLSKAWISDDDSFIRRKRQA